MNGRRRLVGEQRAFGRNLHDAIGRLSLTDVVAGREWWPAAADEVHARAIRFGVRYETAAYAVAALSPGIPWEGALDTLDLLLVANRDGAPMPTGSGHLTFGYRDRRKAWAIITEPNGPNRSEVYGLCRGPKVEAVAAVLLGDPNAVPVDRHVIRAATGTSLRQVGLLDSRRISTALQALAYYAGADASALQAALWIAGSRSTRRNVARA